MLDNNILLEDLNIYYEITDAKAAQVTGGVDYTVEAGDTLFGIAEELCGDGNKFTEIAAANGISDPNFIEPGQQLTIPCA